MALQVGFCTLKQANMAVLRFHRHMERRPAVMHLWSHAVWKGVWIVGAAVVMRPVGSRAPKDVVEVCRLATDGSRNACSMLLGAAAREARKRGYTRIWTYTRTDESGASLRGAGWTQAKVMKGKRNIWNRRKDGRKRAVNVQWGIIRWDKYL